MPPPLVFQAKHIEPLRSFGRLSLLGEHADLPPSADPVGDLAELRRAMVTDPATFDEVNNWMTASAISHGGFMMLGVWRFYVQVIGEEAAVSRCAPALVGFTKAMGSLRLGNRKQFMTDREIAAFVDEYGSEPPQTTAPGAPPDWGPGGRAPIEPPSPVAGVLEEVAPLLRRRGRRFDVKAFASRLADYGRQAALGDWSGLDGATTVRGCAPLRDELSYGPTPQEEIVSALCGLALDSGGWTAVGVWRFLFWDYDAEYKQIASIALDASARALVREVGLLNPYWFMETAEIDSYVRQFGAQPDRGTGDGAAPQFA